MKFRVGDGFHFEDPGYGEIWALIVKVDDIVHFKPIKLTGLYEKHGLYHATLRMNNVIPFDCPIAMECRILTGEQLKAEIL